MAEEEKDGQEVHETPAEEPETEPDKEEVIVGDDDTLTPEQIADLKKKADASSQNFERLKKAEKERDDLRAQLQETGSLDTDGEDVEQLKTKISEIEGKLHKSEVLEKYPVLKDVWAEFEQYTNDDENQGMKLETAAKAFITEKELNTTQRKGLEKGTGGDKTPHSPGMTPEQLEKIRKEDGKKYREMLKKGQIKFKK